LKLVTIVLLVSKLSYLVDFLLVIILVLSHCLFATILIFKKGYDI